MRRSDSRGRFSFKLHFRLIQLISWMVPRRFRDEWREEWQGELWHREVQLREWQRLDWRAKLYLMRRSLGSFFDALWFQKHRLEDEMIQDLRYGIRMLFNAPLFTAVAVLSLALGIGANTAIFSLVNAALLEKLPVRNPEELVLLHWVSGMKFPMDSLNGNLNMEGGQSRSTSLSYPAFERVRDHNEVFTDTFAFTELERLNVSIDGQAELSGGQIVSGGYFSGLGISGALGRMISAEDDRPDAEAVAVISFGYWQRRFGRDPSAMGKVMYINGSPFTIIGVMPQEFSGTLQVGSAPEITVPMSAQPLVIEGEDLLKDAGNWWLQVMGRLKAGVSADEARASLDRLFQQSVAESISVSKSKEEKDPARLEVASGSKGLFETRGSLVEPLLIMMVVVGLVLAIACANIANLLLARAAQRQKEIAVRMALGASRLRLIRQLLTESLMLALAGGGLGLVLAYWSKGFLPTLLPTDTVSLNLDLSPDIPVLVFTAGVSILTGLLFGLAPALRATRVDLMPSLKDNARSVSRARSRLSKILLVAQVAVSLLLLIGAGLFVRTLQNLEKVELGFNKENLLLFKVDPTLNGYKPAQIASLYEQMADRIEAIPGVQAVTLSSHTLISNSASITKVSTSAFTPTSDDKKYVYRQKVRENFLETLGIPLLMGRNLTSRDDEQAQKVVIVNEAFAREYFPGENPIGKHFSLEGRGKGIDVEIVGMARDAKYASLRDEPPATVYEPYLQSLSSLRRVSFEVRTAGDPINIASAVRDAAREVDSSVPVFDLKTQSEQVDEHLSQERLFARLSGFFGLLALALASIGLYGLFSYSVARRTHEIGIRLALGARPEQVLWLVMKEILVIVFTGVAIGLPAAIASTQVITSMLFGLSATDPVTILIAVLFLMSVSALAGYLPARRASRVGPMVALKCE